MQTTDPVVVTWGGEGLRFRAQSTRGTVDMSSTMDEPGLGLTPTQLLAAALAGCTAMDVVSILQKMRQPLRAFRVEVRGERAEDHPRRFVSMQLTCYLAGDLEERKVRRAIELSDGKFCSVSATLRPGVHISTRYVLEP